jgi:tetratricopeptide (TPR) repeat protein
MKTALYGLLVFLISLPIYAGDVRILPSRVIEITYLESAKKVNATEVSLRVRDEDSGKLAQVTLQKKTGASQIWEGRFFIQFFKEDLSARVLEFLDLKNRPYFVHFTANGPVQRVILFSTQESMEKYLSSQSPEKAKPAVGTPPIKAKEPQISSEELEARKRAQIIEMEAKLTAQQKEQNRQAAVQLAKKADAYYQKKDFSQARKLYDEALRRDPENQSYLYRYAISLYKNGDYRKALVNLTIAEVPENLLVERDYFMALSNLNLKDYDRALKGLKEVRDENSADLSPTASFLAGTIEYQRQDFSAARKSMEYVLDYSKDPKMDTAAEDMLDQIDRMESFLASKKEKYRFTFFAGPIYDQNVLNVASNNVATDVQALRATYGLSALGILYRTMSSDIGAQVSVSDYYSTNTKLQPDATLQAADPLQFEITLPFHKELVLGSRAINLELIPSVKSIMMSATGGSRDEIIRSSGVTTSISAPLSRGYYFSGKLDYSSEVSYLSSSVGEDDQTGVRYGLTLSPTKFLDTKGERALSSDLSYLINQSGGANYRYQKWGISLSYSTPIFWNSNGTLKIDYTNQSYGEAATPRTDNTYALSGVLSKKISNRWSLMTNLQYSIANSDLDLYNYNKLMIMNLFNYTYSVQDK